MNKPVEQNGKIPAAALFRMSSDDQKTSIQQQEKEVEALAGSRGYEIVRRYYDAGKSGSKDQEKRVEFQRLLADATTGLFKMVLCYDSSRFARLDSIDAAEAKQALRRHGISLETVKEGKIDWTTFEGRLHDVILSEANHKYSRDLSRESLRGRLDRLQRQQWPNGAVPYGYDRVYTDGTRVQRVTRHERFQKPRNWRLTLVECELEAGIVREVFKTYRKEATSLRQLAYDLSKRGVPGPRGKHGWNKTAVKTLLQNRAYLGYGRIGLSRFRQKQAFNRATPLEVSGCCPALVDEETFNAVQKKLAALTEGRRPQRNRSSILSGILVCGHCGYRLQKQSRNGGDAYFTCASASSRPQLGCHQWRVYEKDILPRIIELLKETVDRDVLEKLHAEPPELDDAGLVTLEKERAALKERIDRGNERYLTAPKELMPGLLDTMKRWQAELKEVEAKFAGAKLKTRNIWDEIEAWYLSVQEKLSVLAEASAPSKITMSRAQVPKGVVLAARKQFPNLPVVHCKMTWAKNGDVQFGEGPLYEIQEDNSVWVIEQEGEYQKPIVIEQSVLRQFLVDTDTSVTLYWKPKGTRYFELDHGRLTAQFGKHFLAGHSSMHCHDMLDLFVERIMEF